MHPSQVVSATAAITLAKVKEITETVDDLQVINRTQVSRALKQQLPKTDKVWATEEMVELCVKEAQEGKRRWLLMFSSGYSFQQILKQVGIYPNGSTQPPCFCAEDVRYLHYSSTRPFKEASVKPGYHLISLDPEFRGMHPAEQERAIGALGLQRLHLTLACQAALALAPIPFNGWEFISDSFDVNGNRLGLEFYDGHRSGKVAKVLGIPSYPANCTYHRSTGTCVMRTLGIS